MKNLLFKMEDIKDAIVETLEDVNVVIVEAAEDVKDFAVEKMKDFKEAVIETEVSLVKSVETSVSLEVDEMLELAGFKLEEMKETKMEEMVEEVKPRLRRETFENSFLLSRVGGRQFLLVLLIIAQVMMQIEMLMMQDKMLMLMFILTIGLMLSVKTIVILLMLGLLFFLGGPPPASPRPLPAADPGMDWLRLIQIATNLDHHRGLCQVAAEPAGGVHHPPPHLASCKLGGQALSRRQEVICWTKSCWCCCF